MLLLAAGASVTLGGGGEVIADWSIFLDVCDVCSDVRSSTFAKHFMASWHRVVKTELPRMALPRNLFAPARMTICTPTNLRNLVVVSRTYNSTKDVEIWVNNTLRASLTFLVKLKRERKDARTRDGAKNKNHPFGDHVV